jgi:hypothetical protein
MNYDYQSLLYYPEDVDYKLRNNNHVKCIHNNCQKIKFNECCFIYIKDNNCDKTIVHDCSTGNLPFTVIQEFIKQKEYNYILIDNTGYRYSATKDSMANYSLSEINVLNEYLLRCIKSMGYKKLYLITICAAIYFWDMCCKNNPNLYSKLIAFTPAVRGKKQYLADGINKDFFERSEKLTDDIVTTKLYLSNDILKETDKEIIPKQTYFNNKLKLEMQEKIVSSFYMVDQIPLIKNIHALFPEDDNYYTPLGMGMDLFTPDNYTLLPGDHFSYYFNPENIFTNNVYSIIKESK